MDWNRASRSEKIAAYFGGTVALLIGIAVGVPLILAVLDSFLALDIWPWAECVWDYSDYFDYPVKRAAYQCSPTGSSTGS